MKKFGELHIDFYSREEASIRMSFISIEKELLYEVTFYSAYIIKQLSNLRGSGIDNLLASALKEAQTANLQTFNLGSYINAADITINVPRIVTYHGKGKKVFYATISLGNGPNGLVPILLLDVKGFGLLGAEVKYYAIQSVNVLTRWVAVKYKDNELNQSAFKTAAFRSADEYLSGNVGMGPSHGDATARVVNQIFPNKTN